MKRLGTRVNYIIPIVSDFFLANVAIVELNLVFGEEWQPDRVPSYADLFSFLDQNSTDLS